MKPRSKLKTYGSLDGAVKAANGRPFVRLGDLYIVPDDPNETYELSALTLEIMCVVDGVFLRRGASIRLSTLNVKAKKGMYKLPTPAGFEGIE